MHPMLVHLPCPFRDPFVDDMEIVTWRAEQAECVVYEREAQGREG